MRKLTSWLAILAMALQALWPLIAQAKPANLVPVCAVGGVTHYVEVPGAPAPADSQHCEFCFTGVALPVADSVHTDETSPFISAPSVSYSPRSFTVVAADARAPPVLPVVVSFDNNNGRTNEKAFAWHAADPRGGGSVVRLGVLHG